MKQRPETSEHHPYFKRYIDLVPGRDVLVALTVQIEDTVLLLESMGEEMGDFRYQPGKWSVKEVVGHLADTERVMSYRALRFARSDETQLPGFEQDDFVDHGAFSSRTLASLTQEFRAVRLASLALFEGIESEAWSRRGVADGSVLSVRAVAYILAGHELHHREILRSLYRK